ncbi:zinc-binding protein A33-like [Dendrobates tinctorius]|uniref:zinc-binding protein A33-like n=1 Tax=Dendrobates tinctorius TaxID=92724 RepID=UPI003CCA51CB
MAIPRRQVILHLDTLRSSLYFHSLILASRPARFKKHMRRSCVVMPKYLSTHAICHGQEEHRIFPDNLGCLICHQVIKDPAVLQSCGHNFCHACLQGQWGDAEGNDKTCPICKETLPADMGTFNIALVEKVKEPENKEMIKQILMAPQDISDQLTCSLCNNTFRDSVFLKTCGHNFCHKCVQKRSTATDQGEIECPICKLTCPRDGYAYNRDLANLLERINRPANQEGQANDPVNKCEAHKERITLFCLNDETLCCLVCRDSFQHQSHKLLPLTEASNLIQVRKTECAASPRTAAKGRFIVSRGYMTKSGQPSSSSMLSYSIAASPLTLDPETAHRNLLLSEDLTRVSYKPSVFRRVVDSPKRFAKFDLALTSEGFNNGRHYWEVDIDGKDWDIGLMKETQNRKETDHIFLLDLWGVSYNSQLGLHLLSKTITILGIYESPKRVGVYLDYEDGQISYDVQKKNHL